VERVYGFIKAQRLVDKGKRVLVGVSGGPDSVALLLILRELERRLGCGIAVGHLNHMLRGREAFEDEEFVRKFCEERGIEFYCQRRDIGEIARRVGGSIEEVARKVRYDFLADCAREAGARFVAVGHTKDDLVETVLMSLIRGTGLEGLAGIPKKRPLGEGVILVRPILCLWREEVVKYLEKKGVPYRVDRTNLEPCVRRNKIRLELIPYLETFNPRVKEALARLAEIVEEENNFMDEMARQVLENSGFSGEGIWAIKREDVKGLHRGLVRRILKCAFEDFGVEVGFESVAKFMDLLYKGRGSFTLPRDVQASCQYGWLILAREVGDFEYNLTVPGEVFIKEVGVKIRAEFAPLEEADFSEETVAYLDSDTLQMPLRVRNWRRGDKFHPYGMKGSKKLHDFFIDEKIPHPFRKRIPLLLSGDEIAWVAGFRVGDRFAVRESTKKLVRVSLEVGFPL